MCKEETRSTFTAAGLASKALPCINQASEHWLYICTIPSITWVRLGLEMFYSTVIGISIRSLLFQKACCEFAGISNSMKFIWSMDNDERNILVVGFKIIGFLFILLQIWYWWDSVQRDVPLTHFKALFLWPWTIDYFCWIPSQNSKFSENLKIDAKLLRRAKIWAKTCGCTLIIVFDASDRIGVLDQ